MQKSAISRGQGLTEYAIILVLIAIVVVAALQLTGTSVSNVLGAAGDSLQSEAIDLSGTVIERFANLDQWDILRGEWEVNDGQLLQTVAGENQILSRYSGTDYAVEVQNAHLTQGNGYGIFFRASGNENRVNGYTFQYDPGYGRGAFIMRKWTNGHEHSPFARINMPDFDWNRPHDVKVVTKGDRFTAYVDGKPVLNGRDDTYPEGRVGFRTWSDSVVSFDDLTVVPTS